MMLLSMGLQAGPIQWGQVANDAKWVAHIDFEGLRQTKIYQQISDLFLKKPMAELESKMEEELGMKVPIDGLVSVTAYGKTLSKEPDKDGVLLMELTPDLKKVATDWLSGKDPQSKLKRPEAIKPAEGGMEGVYSIENEITIASDTDSNFLCAGPSKERIVEKIQQIGATPLDGPIIPTFEEHPFPEGTVAYVALANIFEGAPIPPQQAKVLQMSKGASLSLGETDGNVFLKLHLRTQDANASLQIQRILAGIQAMALLQAKQPEWFPLLQAIDIRNDNQHVQVNWNLSLQNANKLIHALQGSEK